MKVQPKRNAGDNTDTVLAFKSCHGLRLEATIIRNRTTFKKQRWKNGDFNNMGTETIHRLALRMTTTQRWMSTDKTDLERDEQRCQPANIAGTATYWIDQSCFM
jgi:hypothetical protein